MVYFLICSATIDICEFPPQSWSAAEPGAHQALLSSDSFSGWLTLQRRREAIVGEKKIPVSIITATHLQKTPWAFSASAQCFLNGLLGATPHIVSRFHHKYLNSSSDMRGHAFPPQCVIAWKWKHQLYETPFFIYSSICTDGSITRALGKYAGAVVFSPVQILHEGGSMCRIGPDSRSSLGFYSFIGNDRV